MLYHTAVTEVISTAYDNISANLHTGLVFLDIKKAFDTVSHDILIQKLEHYGIRGIANDLLNSYLRSRKQFVMVDEIEHSDLFQIKSGFPRAPLWALYYFCFTLMIWSIVHPLQLFCLLMTFVLVLVLHVQLN